MYSYTWDAETGGLLLNSSPLSFSKEPRPVYYKELDILGFDRYWNYEKNDSYPYMWAEANNYFYRGRQVAKTKGGSLYTPPEIVIMDEPEPDGQPLRFVDIPAMVEKNRDLLEKLASETIKKIYNTDLCKWWRNQIEFSRELRMEVGFISYIAGWTAIFFGHIKNRYDCEMGRDAAFIRFSSDSVCVCRFLCGR